MDLFRPFTAPLVVLLALIVGGETTDLIPCADGDCGVWHVLLDGEAEEDHEPTSNGTGQVAECLCHVVLSAAPPPVRLIPLKREEPGFVSTQGRYAPPSRSVPTPPPRG